MRMVFSIRESSHGLWCISKGTVLVHDQLRFARAIRLSRALARVEHERTGHTVCVEMVCSEFTIALLKFSAVTAAGHVANARTGPRRDQEKPANAGRNPDACPVRANAHTLLPESATRLRAIF